MGENAQRLLELVIATARMATQVWPDGEVTGETWREGWARKFGSEVPPAVLEAMRDGVTVRLYGSGRLVLEQGTKAQIHQLRIQGAIPTALELSAGRFREHLAERLAEFWDVPMPSRRER